MNRLVVVGLAAVLFAGTATGQGTQKPPPPESVKGENEARYLAFQIFIDYSPDPRVASQLSSGSRERLVPGTRALRNYVEDIKRRTGTVGDERTRLAVMLGPHCFEQTDAELAEFVERAFDLALETDVAVGFHIDDSIFWLSARIRGAIPKTWRPWTGTAPHARADAWTGAGIRRKARSRCASTARRFSGTCKSSPPCWEAIRAGVKQLQERNKPELFAGVIAGWETMLGQDFKTGKYLGYRALMNRGFSRTRPPEEVEKTADCILKLMSARAEPQARARRRGAEARL